MDLPVIAENTGLRLSFERGIANSTPGTGRYGVKYLSYQVRDSLIVYVERIFRVAALLCRAQYA